MGHLLGAPPARPNPTLVIANPPGALRWTYVTDIELPSPGQGIAAFAIDTPRVGDRLPGAGLEINGWIIGETAPARSVRVVTEGSATEIVPLHIRRPDVAADYPQFPHAATSGFSLWTPLSGLGGSWRLTVEAILDDGSARTLAKLSGRAEVELRTPRDGSRLVTAPDFAIIGAQRGGTTSLHAYLSAHPQVQTPSTKELHYVTDRHSRGRDWYLGQFPTDVPLGTLTGEATPYALFHPLAPQRMHEIAPAAKLIVLLRNPVDRAYSHFLLETSRGHETLPFALALAAEPARLAGEQAKLLADSAYVSLTHNHASYLSRGDYAPQLERWLDLFPRAQMLVLRSEDLYQRTADTFDQVVNFLGLPPAPNIPFTTHNPTSGPPLDAATRDRLERHFAPLNENLASLLGWKVTWE